MFDKRASLDQLFYSIFHCGLADGGTQCHEIGLGELADYKSIAVEQEGISFAHCHR